MHQSSARLISSALVCCALALGAGGCAVGVRGPVPLGSVVYVDRAPPAAFNEVITVSPGPGYVWIGGYHGWNGRDYVWNRGHWTVPARGYTRWTPGAWHRDGRGHYWVAGRWH